MGFPSGSDSYPVTPYLLLQIKGIWKTKLMHAMALFSSFLPFDTLQIHHIVPIKHSVDTEKQLDMTLLQAFLLPTPPPSTFMSVLPNFCAIKISRGTTQLRYMGTITNPQIVLNTPKSPYLNQATPKNTCQNFPTPKKSRYRKFQTLKNPLIIPVT